MFFLKMACASWSNIAFLKCFDIPWVAIGVLMLRFCVLLLFWTLVILGTLWLTAISVRYFWDYDTAGFPHSEKFYHTHRFLVRFHVGAGLCALLAGPFLFIATRGPTGQRLHRCLGAIYLGAVCLIAAPTAIWLLQAIHGRLCSQIGLFGLSLAWFSTTLMVLVRRAAPSHQRWAVRSYSLTLAAITFRAVVAMLLAGDIAFETAYTAAAWIWPLHLVVAAWYTKLLPLVRR
jgi:hypothetical protein